MLSLSQPVARRRRIPRDPRPRFKADVTNQLDPIRGCPALQLDANHLARKVRELVEAFDVSSIEAKYSALGRRGYHPRHVLAVWILGYLRSIHESTKLARCVETDAAFRFVSGGHAISAATLRRFKSRNLTLFLAMLEQTVRIAQERGLIQPEELAVDSLRLRAHASNKAVRQLERSKKRLVELDAVDVDALTADERTKHEQKRSKHEDAVRRCEATNRTSIVLTNEAAALMKFPDGASAPGHRVTVVAAGVKERLIVSLLVDASTTDYGKLEEAALGARRILTRNGVPEDQKFRMNADAGYCSEADLSFAAENRHVVDILVAERTAAREGEIRTGRYGGFARERFTIDHNLQATCPAGRLMKGPVKQASGRVRWEGIGCETCSLKPQCTSSERRTLTASPALDAARDKMSARMSEPGARTRYSKRMATVEPVFSMLESVMGYRRATTRFAPSVVAEIVLHALAHNIARLISRAAVRPLLLVLAPPDEF